MKSMPPTARQSITRLRALLRTDAAEPELQRCARELVTGLEREPEAAGEGLELFSDLLRSPRQEQIARALDLEILARLARPLAGAADAAGARAWLELVRRPAVLRRIAASGARDEWWELLAEVIDGSEYTLGSMLEQRTATYGPRTFLREPWRGSGGNHSWLSVMHQVENLARALERQREELGPGPLAVLSENCLEMALLDLACLTHGFVNVPLPVQTTDSDIVYLLQRLKVRAIFVSTPEQLRRLLAHRTELPGLARLITFFEGAVEDPAVMPLARLLELGQRVGRSRPAELRREMRLDDLATVMVTSGTTGRPKGIRFTQRNLVTKRFARALALPEIGDQDAFLCYLPLFHTFGRYLELLGCLFWGSTYNFLLDPSSEALVEQMGQVAPSVFISIPKKWIQLYETVTRQVELETASEAQLEQATRATVGRRLRWGLSAAGYLPAEVFRFFQRQGVELLSGFGMTEATGGITMTPPGEYRDDSLGVPLPGIEVRLDEDGELMIRGPYVMLGYVSEDESETGVDEKGWVRSGDLMRSDEAGHLRIIDRKKEIYKNVKGETIAPQRVENLFRDFHAVRRVFLVGDHREFNTLLIVPNEEVLAAELPGGGHAERRAYLRSLVVPVNQFLAPFERVVDFALLDRDFEEERDELTRKGTYRRKVIEQNFLPVIERLYARRSFPLEPTRLRITIPNWLYQALGLTARDIQQRDDCLVRMPNGARLTMRLIDGDRSEVQIGSCSYRLTATHIDLGALLAAPVLWLGNDQLLDFFAIDDASGVRRRRPPRGTQMVARVEPYQATREQQQALRHALEASSLGLKQIDLAARMLAAPSERQSSLALRVLERALSTPDGPVRGEALAVLRTAAHASSPATRRRAFAALFGNEEPAHARETLLSFLAAGELLDEETIRRLSKASASPPMVDALLDSCAPRSTGDGAPATSPAAYDPALLGLIAGYGAAHPGVYKRFRWALSRLRAFSTSSSQRELVRSAARTMQEGFRLWLGAPTRLAVDPETGKEYGWEDVITFEEEMGAADRQKLLGVIRGTNLVREAIFLFSGRIVRLSDLPLGGMWISLIGEKHGKAVFHLKVHTRLQGSYDVAINVNRTLDPEAVEEEILWLMAVGEEREGARLVEDFGGYWRQYDLWSEEFISGETINRFVGRLARRRTEDAENRLRTIWPFIVWSAAEAYLEFWNRTGRRFVIGDPSDYNVIVPTHDFQVGARIVSVSGRAPAGSLAEYLDELWQQLVVPNEEAYAALAGGADRTLLLRALLEAVGVEEGIRLLEGLGPESGIDRELVAAFLEQVRRLGFLPKRLYFAIRRYHRWEALAGDATPQARARTLRDLFDTYNIATLLSEFPDARVRFFRETVFQGGPQRLLDGLDAVIAGIRGGELAADGIVEAISSLRQYVEPGSAWEYFLTRLSYPHLRPGDTAEVIFSEAGGGRQAEVVVVLEDIDGRPFRVRPPVNPREVGRLHRLFLTARLDVTFRPEHRYLVAVSERGDLLGGLFYEVDEELRRAHLEKIAVLESLRKHGISDGLMNELFRRLRAQGLSAVTTGFFRPSYFYRFGFGVERGYAGLVKDLGRKDEPDSEPEA